MDAGVHSAINVVAELDGRELRRSMPNVFFRAFRGGNLDPWVKVGPTHPLLPTLLIFVAEFDEIIPVELSRGAKLKDLFVVPEADHNTLIGSPYSGASSVAYPQLETPLGVLRNTGL